MGVKRFRDKISATAFKNDKKKRYKHVKLVNKGKGRKNLSSITLKRGKYFVRWGKAK